MKEDFKNISNKGFLEDHIIENLIDDASTKDDFLYLCGLSCRKKLPFSTLNVIMDGLYYADIVIKLPMNYFDEYTDSPFSNEIIYINNPNHYIKDISSLETDSTLRNKVHDVVDKQIKLAYDIQNSILDEYFKKHPPYDSDNDNRNKIASIITKRGFVAIKNKLGIDSEYLDKYFRHTSRILLIDNIHFKGKSDDTINYFIKFIEDIHITDIHHEINFIDGLDIVERQIYKYFPKYLFSECNEKSNNYFLGYLGVTLRTIDEYLERGHKDLAINMYLTLRERIISIKTEQDIDDTKYSKNIDTYNISINERGFI